MPQEFLGRGLRFPIGVDPSGAFDESEAEDKIRESVFLILSTALGERQMRFDFGNAIHDEVFAPIRAATLSLVSFDVQEALIAWEPRIDVVNVSASDEQARDGVLLVSVDYSVRATNNRFNLVYPFFVKGFAA
jgi:phage baseplate assembly protein W